MRFLRKLLLKLVTMIIMVALLGGLARYARPMLMKSAGLPTDLPTSGAGTAKVHFSSEESDLMATVFRSAIRLLTGSASRKELAGELSDKLYAGRADKATMQELGIELVQPGGNSSVPATPAKPGANPSAAGSLAAGANPAAAPSEGTRLANLPPDANPASKLAAAVPSKSAASTANNSRNVFLDRLRNKAVANPELAFAPVVLTGMLVVYGVRRRRNSLDDFGLMPDMAALLPPDSEPYDMTHAVHALRSEDFELLVALVYQRQGYRVTMPAGLSGGHGIDFTLQRKSERVLVQCKHMRQDHRLPIERVRELHEAVQAAGATRGLYVASCGYNWDARNFAKSKGLTVINARTLDALITEAREDENEDLLAVADWAPKFLSKVKLTPPSCPTCEAEMEWTSASGGTVWVCSQRPECRGRRSARRYQTAVQSAPQARPTALARITASINFTKLTRVIKSASTGTPVKLAETAAPAKSAAVAKPATAAKTAAASAPSKPTSTEKPVASAKPAASSPPTASAKATDPAKPAAPAKPAVPVAVPASAASAEPVTAVTAAESGKPAVSAKLGKLAKFAKLGIARKSDAGAEPAPPARLLEVFPNPNGRLPDPRFQDTWS